MSYTNATPTPLFARLKSIALVRATPKSVLASLVLPAILLLAPSARGQTMQIFPLDPTTLNPQNLFVGANFSGTYPNVQIRVVLPGGNLDPIHLDGVSLPAGVSVTFNNNDFTNSTTVTLTVAVTNVTAGRYPLTIQASNTVTTITTSSNLVNLIAGKLWTAATNSADFNWTTAANWSTGVAPVAGDDIMFQDGPVNTNVVNGSITLGSLTYIRNNSGATHTSILTPGTTLSVTGTNGFVATVDGLNGGGKTTTVFIQGTNASLIASNESANFVVNALNGGGAGTVLNMSLLDNFTAVVNQFGFCDVNLANQGAIGAQVGQLFFARTNLVRALFVGDYNQTFMTNAITFFNNGDIGNNGSASTVNMGIVNRFEADSMRIALSRVGAGGNTVRINPAFVNSNATVTVRNTGGGRMTLLGIAFDTGANNSGNNSQGTFDLRNSTADVLVDRMVLGQFRSNSAPAGASARGVIFLQNGLVDVNNLVLGYQPYTNDAFVRGTLNVVGTGTFRVNNTIEIAHTTGTTNVAAVVQSFGQISVTSTGTVSANSIEIVGDLSNNNNITLGTGGRLIVTNAIAGPNKWMTTLAMTGASTLMLHINGANTNPYVYVTNLNVTVGQNNILRIGSVDNLVVPPGGTNVPLFAFAAGGANFAQVVMPAGLQGSLLANGPNQIDLVILANTPKNIVWRGGANSNWDTTSTNWLDLDTLLVTNFVNGDTVFFDDAPGIPTTITLALPVLIANSISMTNTANAYTFTGGGALQGSATLLKTGLNSLTVNAATTVALQINEGLLNGNGSAGSVNIGPGARIDFSGNISSGLSCAGSGTYSGSSLGGMSLLGPSGALTNMGTISGQLSFQSGTVLVNSNTLINIGASTVAGGATLINAANIGADLVQGTLTVNGTLKDYGAGSIYVDVLTIGGGGRFIPGGDGIGTTAVRPNSFGTFPGRVQLQTGSTNLFKVDPGAPANTLLLSGTQDFGPSQSQIAFNGCTLSISNTTGAPFTGGQSFKMFGNAANGGVIFDSGAPTNSYPIMDPPAPGPGLVWDLTHLRPDGIIIVNEFGTNPVNLQFTATPSIVINTNGAGSTNAVIISNLQWPTNYVGWRLQQQFSPMAVGLTTNWTTIATSALTNDMSFTNNLVPGTVFFRMIYP